MLRLERELLGFMITRAENNVRKFYIRFNLKILKYFVIFRKIKNLENVQKFPENGK